MVDAVQQCNCNRLLRDVVFQHFGTFFQVVGLDTKKHQIEDTDARGVIRRQMRDGGERSFYRNLLKPVFLNRFEMIPSRDEYDLPILPIQTMACELPSVVSPHATQSYDGYSHSPNLLVQDASLRFTRFLFEKTP